VPSTTGSLWLVGASAALLALMLAWPPGPGGLVLALLAAIAVVTLAVVLRQWVAAARPLPSQAATGGRLAVILPARNECAAIGEVLRRIPRPDLAAAGWSPFVVVVDDGSCDDTGAVARRAGADLVVRHESGRGLGAALRSGLGQARRHGADAAVYLDADGEYDPAQMLRLLAPIRAGEADYVLGSRFRGRREGMCWQRTLGNRGFTWLTCMLAGRRLTDAQTGYRAFSRRALERAEIVHDYNYAQVLTLDLLRKRIGLAEVPIDYRVRRSGRSFIRGAEYCRRVLPAIARELLAD
jgi:glycosyltransferase involved in cell wall biosynthesis